MLQVRFTGVHSALGACKSCRRRLPPLTRTVGQTLQRCHASSLAKARGSIHYAHRKIMKHACTHSFAGYYRGAWRFSAADAVGTTCTTRGFSPGVPNPTSTLHGLMQWPFSNGASTRTCGLLDGVLRRTDGRHRRWRKRFAGGCQYGGHRIESGRGHWSRWPSLARREEEDGGCRSETGLVACRPAKGAAIACAALSGHVYRRDVFRSRRAGSKTVTSEWGWCDGPCNLPQIYLKEYTHDGF